MTYSVAVTAQETLGRLLDLARMQGKTTDALPFALAWLVIGKLAAQGRMAMISHVTESDPEDVPTRLARLDVPAELRAALIRALSDKPFSIQNEASYLVTQLLAEPQQAPWLLQDAAWVSSTRSRSGMDGPVAYDPQLCDLVVGSLLVQPGELVWVPFDQSGQFTIRLIRLGAQVWRAGPAYGATDLVVLLLGLEDEGETFARVTFASTAPGSDGSRPATKCLVAPPMGAKVSRSLEWRRWEQTARGGRELWVHPGDMDRSDAWTVAAFWPVVEKRAAFLTSPSLVFAQGQEHRLRKALLLDLRGNMVRASVSLPGGMLSMTTLAPALLILDAENRADRIRVVDLAGVEGQRSVRHRLGKDIAPEAAVRLLGAEGPIPQLAEDIDLREIEESDFTLVPQRYLRRIENLAGNRRPLGELLAATIRSPAPTKDLNAWPVWEIGIPRLDQWRPIASGYDRHMSITPKKADEALLREGDLVLSIKGTVGKVGIVGNIPSSYADAARAHPLAEQPMEEGSPIGSAAVAAASCVALRVDRQQLLPEYLLLYLRSDDFKQQLEALRVGTTIAHITPAALLSGVRVLVLPLEEQAALCRQYRELCEMEVQMEELQRRMSRARNQLFTTINQQN